MGKGGAPRVVVAGAPATAGILRQDSGAHAGDRRSSRTEPRVAHLEIHGGGPRAVRDVDAGVQSEFAGQLVAKTDPAAADVLSGRESIAGGTGRAGPTEGNEAPPAEDLPARLQLE